MPNTTIGRLNQRATIQRAVQTPDGRGGFVAAWTPLLTSTGAAATPYVLVEPLTAREAVYAAQLGTVLPSAVTLWWRSDLSVKDRILVPRSAGQPPRTLQIVAYQDPTGDRRELRILCSELEG